MNEDLRQNPPIQFSTFAPYARTLLGLCGILSEHALFWKLNHFSCTGYEDDKNRADAPRRGSASLQCCIGQYERWIARCRSSSNDRFVAWQITKKSTTSAAVSNIDGSDGARAALGAPGKASTHNNHLIGLGCYVDRVFFRLGCRFLFALIYLILFTADSKINLFY